MSVSEKSVVSLRMVLIDTWWNVNYMNIRSETGQDPGFNRYMVECEWDLSGKKAAYIAVLIDTWWNVNIRKQIL